MAVFLDQDGFVPALEQVAGPAVALIEELGINAVYLSHTDREIAVGSFDEEMIMIGHEAVCVADPVVSFVDVLDCVQKVLTVRVILEYRLLLVPAGGHMINCAGIFYAEGAGHGGTITEESAKCKEKDLTLIVSNCSVKTDTESE
jgi:hypothetical protein